MHSDSHNFTVYLKGNSLIIRSSNKPDLLDFYARICKILKEYV